MLELPVWILKCMTSVSKLKYWTKLQKAGKCEFTVSEVKPAI